MQRAYQRAFLGDEEGGNASGDDPAIWVHPGDSTNFSLVDWADVAKALHLQVSTNIGNDPRFR